MVGSNGKCDDFERIRNIVERMYQGQCGNPTPYFEILQTNVSEHFYHFACFQHKNWLLI